MERVRESVSHSQVPQPTCFWKSQAGTLSIVSSLTCRPVTSVSEVGLELQGQLKMHKSVSLFLGVYIMKPDLGIVPQYFFYRSYLIFYVLFNLQKNRWQVQEKEKLCEYFIVTLQVTLQDIYAYMQICHILHFQYLIDTTHVTTGVDD